MGPLPVKARLFVVCVVARLPCRCLALAASRSGIDFVAVNFIGLDSVARAHPFDGLARLSRPA